MRRPAGLALVGLLLTTGCSVAGTPSAAPTTTAQAPSTTAAPATDPLAFFRAQEAGCDGFARQVGNSPVEPDRFSGAKVVRALDNGATQIEDGRGMRLVVVPAKGIVLPASGNPKDVMPPPYGFSCSEKVFIGAADH